MPLDHIHAVLAAPDLPARLISAHLTSLEQDLARTQATVASLRDLLAGPAAAAPVRHRQVDATMAAGIPMVTAKTGVPPWYMGALAELHATLRAQGIRAAGRAGGLFARELLADEYGQVTVFIPTASEAPRQGRVEPLVVPAAELAVIEHPGPLTELDRSCGALATYVASHELQVDGPVREHQIVGYRDTADQRAWRTELCWPIFSTGTAA
ncbi:GyrI-like domain-containing protein [Streptomyces mirabilis]|uniref:GyrI-like domain-containing protein n=1 Tax=Streptomyces mirabilis TaxID=68239 RepID=UPI0037116DBF